MNRETVDVFSLSEIESSGCAAPLRHGVQAAACSIWCPNAGS